MNTNVRIKNVLNKYIQGIIQIYKIEPIPPKYASHAKIVKLVKAVGGLSGLVYTFSLIFPENGLKRGELELVLKIYRKNERAVCQRESEILNFLYSKGFSVPRLYISEINDDILEGPFIIMERARGKPMGKCLKEVTDNVKLTIIKRFAETLAFLHSLRWDDLAFLRRPSDEYDYAKYQAILAKNMQNNFKIKGDFDWIIEWIDSNALLHRCHQYSILHGDMHLDNFLVTENGEIVVLDWEYPEIGDPLRDVALAYVNLIFTFGFRELDRGRELGEFFVRQYVKRLKQKIDPLALRFYIVASALIEAICYKFNCKQAFNPFSIMPKLGVKFFIGTPFLSWYFWWRYKILERLIKEEIKCYTLRRSFVYEEN
jgi:thiamine kinase-like enzyme